MTNSMNPIDQLTSNVSKGVARQTIQVGNESRVTDVQQQIKQQAGGIAIQNMVAGTSSQIGGTQAANFQTTIKTAEHDFFFDMVLSKALQDEAGNQQFAPLEPGTALEPDCTYVVRIAISLDRYSSEQGERAGWKMRQSGVRNRGQMRFLIQELCPAGEEGAIETCEPVEAEVPEAEFTSWYEELTIKVKASHTLEATTLQLRYRSANLIEREATMLEVSLDKPVEQMSLPQEICCYLTIDAEPPAQTAFFHIQPTGENQVMCTRWFKEQKDDPRGFPPLELPQIPPCDSDMAYLQAIERGLNDLARNETAGVGLWFEEVLNPKMGISYMVLIDQTEIQLPWEMFKLSNGEYLGAKLVVVRWVAEQYRGRNVALLLNRIDQEGHVTVYSAGPPPPRSSVLCNLKHDSYNRLSLLQYSLLASENGSIAGLVYLSCQNLLTYGDEAESISHLLNGARQGEELRFDDVAECLNHHPIFWVSAPYSGRMLWRNGKTCGFMKAALTQVASGYIGTLAVTDPKFAELVANKLIEQACSKGVNPAYFLRSLRAFYAQKFKEAMKSRKPEEIEKQRRLLLYAFTYVYYGNPQVSLKLIPYRPSVT